MFWGLKIYSGRRYSATVDNSFVISQGVLDHCKISYGIVVLHLVVSGKDYIVALFDEANVQRSLNLKLSPGEEISFYLELAAGEACVHLTGQYVQLRMPRPSTIWTEANTLPVDLVVAPTCDDTERKKHRKRNRVSFNLSDTKVETKFVKNEDTTIKATSKADRKNVEELKYGHGKIAKNGRKVFIRYTGRCVGEHHGDNKVLDKIGKNEKPLCFLLGKGEVMRGLDNGIKGMRVGGQRRITILPTERKPNETIANLPKDMTIEIDVELVNVQ